MSDASAKTSADGSKTKRKATHADALGPRIMLDGQPATGLFVLYAPAMPKTDKQSPNGQILAAAGPKLPPPQFTLCFVDGQGYLQKVDDSINPWDEIAAQLENIDHQSGGHRKKGAAKPIFATVPCGNPHMEKLMEGATYQFCLVGHPNPQVAMAMRDYLNAGKKDERFAFPDDKSTLIFEAQVATDDCEGGKAVHVDLPADPKSYWPGGCKAYGGWVLYRDMPYGHLDTVQEGVKALACDLAFLRYPTGETSNVPFPAQPSEHSGHFGTVLMAATHAFQKDAAAGNAVQVFSEVRPALRGGNRLQASWAYLLGEDKTPPESKPQPDVGVGVVAEGVADAIAAWKADGFRKPGVILVRSNLQGAALWGRQELVFALAVWDEMTKALGCSYGIKMNCTFRELTVPKATGRVECSNHKLGLSVDLQMHHYRHTLPDWPVRFEAFWCPSVSGVTKKAQAAVDKAGKAVKDADAKLGKTQAELAKLQSSAAAGKPVASAALGRAQAGEEAAEKADQAAHGSLDEAKASQADVAERVAAAKSDYQLLWRIYGHTCFPAFDEKGGNMTAADLQAALSAPECLGAQESGLWEVQGRVVKALTAGFPIAKTPNANQVMRALCAPFVANARKIGEDLLALAAKDGKGGLVDSYFRWTVRQFDYNPYESDGGTSGPPIEASTDGQHGKAVRCWLNLTRLGFECGMHRIAAQRGVATGTIKKPDRDPEFPGVVPADESFNLADGDPEEVGPMLSTLADRLKDLQAAPEHWPIQIRLQDGTDKAVHAEDFDLPFLRAWAELIKQPKSGFKFTGVTLTFPLTLDKEAFERRSAALAAVEKNTFTLVSIGERVKLKSPAGESKPLGEWMDALDKLVPRTRESVTEKGKAETVRSQRKTDAEWSVCFIPHMVSNPSYAGPARAILPCAGSPQPLEWWHHDNGAMDGKDWAELATEIGYSEDVVKADSKPVSTVVAGMCQRGLGFPQDRVERTRKLSKTPPENESKIPEDESKIPEGG
jgi:hypothetical protein